MRLALILLLIGLSAAGLIALLVRSHFQDQRKRAVDRANAAQVAVLNTIPPKADPYWWT